MQDVYAQSFIQLDLMSAADSKSQRENLEKAIQAQESLRGVLDDAIIEATIATLKEKLRTLTDNLQQRKLATILFMDIAGHTALIRDLDPEDQMAVVDPAIARLAEKVLSFGGHIARFQGDGFKAVFGLPVAEENDAQQAVRAGLAILAEAEAIAMELEGDRGLAGFHVRVGVSTGQVFSGGETEGEDTVKGMPVHLAARLESAAPPGGMLISHLTYRHIRGVFDVEPQEPILAKGFREPLPVYLVKKEKPRAFHMGWRGVEGIETKTIGRARELDELRSAFYESVNGQKTTVVTLVGEAGVGKSRLVYEFNNWLDLLPDELWYFKGRADQQTQGNPQYLLRDLLAGRFQILDSDSLAAVQAKFTAGLGEFLPGEGEMKAHILGAWLGYDFSDSPHLAPIQDEPEQIKNRASLYLAQFFTALTAESPAIVLLDDVHWADGSSLDTVLDLVRRRPNLPLLIVCLARPSLFERRPDWGTALPRHTPLALEPLSAEDTAALVAEILRLLDPLPQVLVDLISNRASGNPYYAEELVKILIDDGVIETGPEVWQVAPHRLLNLKIPETLLGVLQARLDKLQPDEKQAAQQASVIGRIFWDQALAALLADGPRALPALKAKEFIFPHTVSAFAGTAEYIFKHALLRDVVYETVLKRVRRQSHALVADWLATTAEGNKRGDEYAALIGEHFELAGNHVQAARWYGRAGQNAAAHYAHVEAINYLNLALELIPPEEIAGRFNLILVREKTYHLQGNREAQQQDLKTLASLSERIGMSAQAQAALRQAKYASAVSDFEEAVNASQRAIELSLLVQELGPAADGHWVWGDALWRKGQYAPASVQYQKGLEIAQAAGERKHVAGCLKGLGHVSFYHGDYPAARQNYRQSLEVYQEIGDRWGEGACLNSLGNVEFNLGDFQTAREYYERSVTIFKENGDRHGEGVVLASLGFMAWHQGELKSAISFHERALSIQREIGDRVGEGITLINLGHLALTRGDANTARDDYQQALHIQEEIGDRFGEGISLNELGALALEDGDLSAADSFYQRALSARQEMDQVQYLVEDWAGLARVKLAQGDQAAARAYAREVLDYLHENPRLEGAENTMRAFHFTWETLISLGETGAADDVLSSAAGVIQTYLDKNTDPALTANYLKQPHHAALWEAWSGKRKGQ